MRELVVDLTPACINKTAIHHIALDTFSALAEWFDVTPQYLGKRQPKAVGDMERLIADTFLRALRGWTAASAHVDEIGLYVRDDEDCTPRLYFDPIYTLARNLNPQDVVFVLDMTTLTNPEWHGRGVHVAYERAFRKLLGSPARIVCISHHCAVALRASFAIPRNDIVTVPLYLRELPVADAEPPGVPLESRRFFLCVGSLETRKNLVGLMRAFALSGLASQGWKLVIAGGKGHGHEAIVEAANELCGVELLGFVSDEVLAWLYANAAAFAYPSFLEGFGLPLLEAMSHGLPCLASITGASREVCGSDETLVDPYDVPSIAAGLIACAGRIEQDAPSSRDSRKARAHRFTFESYLDALLPAFDRDCA